jgi:hypothetical protein
MLWLNMSQQDEAGRRLFVRARFAPSIISLDILTSKQSLT